MTYSSGSIIDNADYNTFVSGNASFVDPADYTTANLNRLWGIGYGDSGYGQTSTTLSGATQGTPITAAQWNALFNRMDTIRQHQTGSAFSGAETPTVSAGDVIAAAPSLSTNLVTLSSQRLYHSPHWPLRTKTTTNITSTGAWTNKTTHVITATFASANQARYFFNAGGVISFEHGYTYGGITTTKEQAWYALADLSNEFAFASTYNENTADNAATVTVGANTYSILSTQADSTFGYHELTTTNTLLLTNALDAGLAAYNSTLLIKISAKTNAVDVQGRGDKGSVITFTVEYDDNDTITGYSGDINDGTVTTVVNVIYPSTTYVSDSWGSVTIAKDVTSSQS